MSEDANKESAYNEEPMSAGEEEEMPPIRLSIPDFEDEEEESEEEESEEEKEVFKSQRIAVANFNYRAEDHELKKRMADDALSEEKARRRAESFNGTVRILISFAVGIAVLLSLWLFVQSRTHKINDSKDHKVHFYYSITDQNTVKITSADSLNVNYLEIPDKMNGKDVTCISANAFAGHNSLENVFIPESIDEIGYNAFYDCELLKEVTIPDSVKTVSYCAFKGCKSLTGVRLSNNLTAIEYGLFGECFKLESIEIPRGVVVIEHGAFQRCTGLKQVTLPDTLEKIEYDAFRGCTAMENIEIPDSAKEIGSSVFSGCKSLKSFTVPKNTTGIKSYTFYGCTSLEEVHIHDGVDSISDNAFKNCIDLTIYGKSGSYAEKYAQQYDIPFVDEFAQE